MPQGLTCVDSCPLASGWVWPMGTWQKVEEGKKSKYWFRLHFFFFNKFIYLFIFYFWLCWVFVSVRGLSPVAASGGHSSSRCAGLSLSRPLLLRSTGSRRAGSVVVVHGPSCSVACGIFPDQGSNPCPLHWQADSQPLHHQGSPVSTFKVTWRRLYSLARTHWSPQSNQLYDCFLGCRNCSFTSPFSA